MQARHEPPPWKFLRPADLKQFKNLQFAAKLIVEGYFQGKHRSPFTDYSSEFADYRPYSPGDEIRAVDWRAFARTDRFYIKLFRKETDMNCVIVVDKSSSMGFQGSGDVTKLEYASYLSAAIAYLVIQQGDKAGMAVCDDRLRTYIAPGGTRETLYRMLSSLQQTKPGGSTSLSKTLRSLSGIVKRKGLLIVVSDFLDDSEAVFKALSMFSHRGFAVLLFHTLSDDEIRLPTVANALFTDPESPLTVATEPNVVRQAYQSEIAGFLDDMESSAKARRMHYCLCTTAEPYPKALESYLVARARL